jgi:hypothetical protein
MVKTYTLKTVPQLEAIQWKGDNFEEVREFLGDRYIEAKELFSRDRLTPERLDFLIHKVYKGCCDDKSRYQIIFSNIPWHTIKDMQYRTVLHYGDWLYRMVNSEVFCTSIPAEFEARYKSIEE